MQFCHGDLSLPSRAWVPATYGNGSVEVTSVIDRGRPDAVWSAACRARRPSDHIAVQNGQSRSLPYPWAADSSRNTRSVKNVRSKLQGIRTPEPGRRATSVRPHVKRGSCRHWRSFPQEGETQAHSRDCGELAILHSYVVTGPSSAASSGPACPRSCDGEEGSWLGSVMVGTPGSAP